MVSSSNVDVSSDFFQEVAEALHPGYSDIEKFGANNSVTKNTTEDVWDNGGAYSFPSTADITHVAQAANQAAMLGETVEVQGLDTNWDLIVQNKALDGSDTSTRVALDTALRRVFRVRVLADVVTDQNVLATNSDGSTVYANAMAGNNQTLMAIYTIPNGKTGYFWEYFGDQIPSAAGSKDPRAVTFEVWAADRDNSYEFQLKHRKATTDTFSSFQHIFKTPIKFTQKTDIKITASPTNDKDAEVNAGFSIILKDN